MSKLIYSPTSSLIEGTYTGIKNSDQAVNPVYRSVAFTGDGYLYTHGKKFRLFNVADNVVEGLVFSIQNGTAGFYIDGTAMGTGTVVQSVTGDGVVTASTTNGAVTLGHVTPLTAQQAGTYGSSSQIPIITVNENGHIMAISNSTTIDVSQLRANPTTTAGQYHPVGVINSNLQNPSYQTNFYFDGSGNVYGYNYYLNGTQLSELFAPIAHTEVYATNSIYGHVKLFDQADSEKDQAAHYAATPKAVAAAIATANQYSQDLFAAQDAMVFIGTLTAAGVITAHNDSVATGVTDNTTTLDQLDYKVGWTLRFTTAGTYQGEDVEPGDMIIAIKKKVTEFKITDWAIIQTNISGALTATSNLSGVLYANNSRVINSLALTSGILSSDGSSISFVNPNTTWRDIQVNSQSISTNTLNLVDGTHISITKSNGTVTIGVDTADIIATSASFNIVQDNTTFTYNPTATSTLNIGDLLTLTANNNTYTLSHAAGTKFTNVFGRITTDDYGHITNVTDVSSLPNPGNLIFKVNDGTSILSYSGSENKTLIFANGTDIGFSSSTDANSNIVLTPSITHKYRGIQFFPTQTSESATSLLANTVNTVFTLVGGNNVTLTNVDSQNQNLPAGTLMIHAEDTWRDIQAYKFTSNLLSRSSIGSAAMKFNDDFLYSSEELSISWTEIDDEGRVTYVN